MSSIKIFRQSRFKITLMLVLSLTLFSSSFALAEPDFSNNNFKMKWQRADKAVADGLANPPRSWLWGPQSFGPPNGATSEPYADSPGGQRQVIYFDKARMEINKPGSGAVTNGLLVRELISGKLAISDATSTPRRPANDIPMAGDASGNNGPTYANFTRIASLDGNNPASNRTGQAASDTIDKTGSVGSSSELGSKAKYVFFDSNLKHNVPDVFWNFLNQKGNVFVGNQLVANQPILGEDANAPWLDATGLPLTDAYWAKVTVSGQVKDVLIQAFERRVLTYTPDNDAAFRVEMGNVGQHYFSWRYSSKYDNDLPAAVPTPPGPITSPPPVTTGNCDALPNSLGGASPVLKCAPAGLVMQVTAPFSPDETVSLTVTKPAGDKLNLSVNSGAAGLAVVNVVSQTSEQGQWKFSFKGQSSGKEAETYVYLSEATSQPTLFVSPNSGSLDKPLTIFVVGFQPGEAVRIGFKAPGTNPVILSLPAKNVTSGGGLTIQISIRALFTGDYANLVTPGEWVAIAASQDGPRAAGAVIRLS